MGNRSVIAVGRSICLWFGALFRPVVDSFPLYSFSVETLVSFIIDASNSWNIPSCFPSGPLGPPSSHLFVSLSSFSCSQHLHLELYTSDCQLSLSIFSITGVQLSVHDPSVHAALIILRDKTDNHRFFNCVTASNIWE